MVDFRNQITHEYFGIDQDVVWTIIHVDLVPFEEVIVGLMDNIEPDLKDELVNAYIEDNSYLNFVVEALKELGK